MVDGRDWFLQGFCAPQTSARCGVRRFGKAAMRRLRTSVRTAARTARRAILEATVGSRKLSVPTATSVAPAAISSRAWAARWTPPMPTTGMRTSPATAATCASAIDAYGRPGQPPGAAAEPRLARVAGVGRKGQRTQGVDQRDRVGTARWAARAQAGHVRGVGGQLHDQRLGACAARQGAERPAPAVLDRRRCRARCRRSGTTRSTRPPRSRRAPRRPRRVRRTPRRWSPSRW